MTDCYRCVLLFGAPGVGKGTQGKMLGELQGFVHLATGDMFRSLDMESELGRKFVEYSSRGKLVPDELTVELWKRYVEGMIDDGRYDPETDLLFLDGIPRSLRQAEMLDDHIEPIAILHLAAPSIDEMVRRITRRAEVQGRQDDADEKVVRHRFEVYEQETAPVLDHFDPDLVVPIDALGTIEEVFDRIQVALKSVADRQESGPQG